MNEKKKARCVECSSILEWGDFAFNQEMCIDCFKSEVIFMIERIEHYPSYLWHRRDTHKDILKFMLACISEIYYKKCRKLKI